MNTAELEATAQALVAKGKGILASDESTRTITKRLSAVGVESTEENRRQYRELLYTTRGAGEHISGAILFDETIRQSTAEGTPFPEVLSNEGIIPGIKVDRGAKPLAGAEGEKVTEGLDGLRDRLEEYVELGARFTKWRAVIGIGEGLPSRYALEANAHALGRFAALSQEQGLVPIVEPEVLMDGDHGIERCREVTEATMATVFEELRTQRIHLEGSLLKPNMVVPGKDSGETSDAHLVADRTITALRRTVPAAVPGIVFLSGGQSEEEATEHLNALNERAPQPWELSFSYGRALQESALSTWGGDAGKVADAQAAFLHRAKMNGAARLGRYERSMEKAA